MSNFKQILSITLGILLCDATPQAHDIETTTTESKSLINPTPYSLTSKNLLIPISKGRNGAPSEIYALQWQKIGEVTSSDEIERVFQDHLFHFEVSRDRKSIFELYKDYYNKTGEKVLGSTDSQLALQAFTGKYILSPEDQKSSKMKKAASIKEFKEELEAKFGKDLVLENYLSPESVDYNPDIDPEFHYGRFYPAPLEVVFSVYISDRTYWDCYHEVPEDKLYQGKNDYNSSEELRRDVLKREQVDNQLVLQHLLNKIGDVVDENKLEERLLLARKALRVIDRVIIDKSKLDIHSQKVMGTYEPMDYTDKDEGKTEKKYKHYIGRVEDKYTGNIYEVRTNNDKQLTRWLDSAQLKRDGHCVIDSDSQIIALVQLYRFLEVANYHLRDMITNEELNKAQKEGLEKLHELYKTNRSREVDIFGEGKEITTYLQLPIYETSDSQWHDTPDRTIILNNKKAFAEAFAELKKMLSFKKVEK